MGEEDKNLLDKLKDKVKNTAEGLKKQYGIGQGGNPWPQTHYIAELNIIYPNYRTRGFLPPVSIPIGNGPTKVGDYEFTDWRGQRLNLEQVNIITTKDRFDESTAIPKAKSELVDKKYSTRDHYLIFNDNSTDYFRHGLQVINDRNGKTPFENTDPVMFGFEIVIDDISSPLLNGSILDFLNNYDNISEIESRKQVYEDFKQQFVKFFKTKSTVDINDLEKGISKMRESDYPEAGNNKEILNKHKNAYMSYYLKRINGLDKLSESNTPSDKKYLVDYNKDVIGLTFNEDVSLSIGTLAHLYKLLYWSKPNGKGLIPENLLRFNCDIIISEVRNFNRVRTAVEDGNIEIIKDNVSRYVYSLRECQFYFNTMAHEDTVNLASITTFQDSYTVQFDYKYSTTKFERFVPDINGFGAYVGYDGGSIWKVGNPGGRDGRVSVPTFHTVGENRFDQNGVLSPFVLNIPQDNLFKRTFPEIEDEEEVKLSLFDKFKQGSIKTGKQAANVLIDNTIRASLVELQGVVNTRVALLNRTLNKIINSAGITGISPPKNIYTDAPLTAGGRIFYDVRGQLLTFLGDSLGGAVGGGTNRLVN